MIFATWSGIQRSCHKQLHRRHLKKISSVKKQMSMSLMPYPIWILLLFFYHLSPLAQHASVVREKCFAGCLLHDLQVHRPMPNFLQCRNKSVDNISLAFWKPVIFRLYKDLRHARIGYFCVSKRFRLKINVQPLSRITYCSVKEEE